jgi:hypothetical protein
MRFLSAILLSLLLPTAVRAAKVEMPEWEGGGESATYHLGGGLWPKGLIPEPGGEGGATDSVTDSTDTDGAAPGPTQFYGPQGATEEGGGKPVESNQRQLIENPDGTFTVPEDPVVEEEAYEPLPPLEGELKDIYFGFAPVDFLIDPQRLLTEQKSNDIMRFLEFHSDESEFRIFVMCLGEKQKIPDDVDLEKLHKEWFSDSPTVLMLYYREQPQLTQLVFNESIRSSLPKSVFDRILQNCLREGGMTELAPDQVEKMCIELSIQLYWLSKLMANETVEGKEKAATSTVHELIASPDAPELLREYAPGIFIEDTSKVLSLVFTFFVVVGSLAFIALIGWIILLWRNREHVSGQPILFQEFSISPRLGGEFCGGGFVGMSFEVGEGAN